MLLNNFRIKNREMLLKNPEEIKGREEKYS